MDIKTIPLLAAAADNIMKAAEVTEVNEVSSRCAEALEAIRAALHTAIGGFEAMHRAGDHASPRSQRRSAGSW